MFRRLKFGTVVRLGAGTAAATTACAGGQALWLQADYKSRRPLPEAKGPLQGLVRWTQQAKLPAVRSAAAAAVCAPAAAPPAGHRKNVLFIGDSLVTGVGCSQDPSCGPMLPRAVAEFLSRYMRVDVQWAAIGETGIDVRGLHVLLPAVTREVDRARSLGQHVDAVVVICGLNDLKKAYRSSANTAGAFHHDLGQLVSALQHTTGVQCTVVLPALPVHRAPVFEGIWPLTSFLGRLAGLWDEQKNLVSQHVRRVCFVRNAECDEWWAGKQYWATDGIHPNDAGYRIWGEHIAQSIAQHLQREGV